MVRRLVAAAAALLLVVPAADAEVVVDSLEVTHATLETGGDDDGDGITLSLTLRCDGPRECSDIDALVVTRDGPSEPLQHLGNAERPYKAWRAWDPERGEFGYQSRIHWLGRPGRWSPVQFYARGDAESATIRVRVETIAAGKAETVTVSLPIAGALEKPVSTAVVLSWADLDFAVSDLPELAKQPAVLLHTVDLAARERHEAHATPEFRAALAAFARRGLGDEGTSPLAVEAALRLLWEHDRKAIAELGVELLLAESWPDFDERFEAMPLTPADRARIDQFWSLDGESRLLQLTAAAFRQLEDAERNTLLKRLDAARGEHVSQWAQAVGQALGVGLAELPKDAAIARLTALAEWGAWSALVPIIELPAERFEVLQAAVGRDTLHELARKMARAQVPTRVLAAVGSGSTAIRELAMVLARDGGWVVLDYVESLLAERGIDVGEAVTEERLKEDPALLERILSRYQGAMMWHLGEPIFEEARALERDDKPCLEVLLGARKTIHPHLQLPEATLARCRALAAIAAARAGDRAEAERQLGLIDSDSDERLGHHVVTARLALARELLEAGDLDGAEAAAKAADPLQKAPGTRPLLGAIAGARGDAVLAAGDEDRARELYTEARKLDPSRPTADELLVDKGAGQRRAFVVVAIVLLAIGLWWWFAAWLGRNRTTRAFRRLADEEPTVVPGPTRLEVGAHGVLVRSGWRARMIAWPDLTLAGFATDGTLVLESDGGAIVVPKNQQGDPGKAQQAIETRLRAAGSELRDAAFVSTALTMLPPSRAGARRGITIGGIVLGAGLAAFAGLTADLPIALRVGVAAGLFVGASLTAAGFARSFFTSPEL